MLRSRFFLPTSTFVRYASQQGNKRFMQTIPGTSKGVNVDFGRLNYKLEPQISSEKRPQGNRSSRWAAHGLATPAMPREAPKKDTDEVITIAMPPVRKSRASRFKSVESKEQKTEQKVAQVAPEQVQTTPEPPATSAAEEQPKVEQTTKAKKPRRQLRPRKALITLSPGAVEHLRALLDQPNPQLIRIGVRNRGCSGLTYHLEYVDKPGKFDELVEQDGVQVLIDSKALFSIVGSEMDWIDDKLLSRFIFKNPNSKGTCGCGESFMV